MCPATVQQVVKRQARTASLARLAELNVYGQVKF